MCSTQHGGRFHAPPASAPLSISTSTADKKSALATAGNDYWNVEGNARLLGISGRGLRGWRAGPSADAVRLRQMTWVAETAKMLPPHALYQQCEPYAYVPMRNFGYAQPTILRGMLARESLQPVLNLLCVGRRSSMFTSRIPARSCRRVMHHTFGPRTTSTSRPSISITTSCPAT
jgi:hypothetical protein